MPASAFPFLPPPACGGRRKPGNHSGLCVGGVSQALLLPPALLLAAETSHSTACWDQWEALEPGVAFLLQRQGAEGSVPVAEARAPALGQALGRRAGQRG